MLAAIAAVVMLLDALVLISADPASPSIAIDGPVSTRTALPSPSPTLVTPSITPSEVTSITEVPPETPTAPAPSTTSEAPTTPASSPAPIEYGPAVFTTTVAVDGAHYYDGEAVHITVEVCNPEDHHVRRQYHRHEPVRVWVIDYWHDYVASAVPVEAQADDPVRKETWTPGECRTHEYDWALWAGDPDQDRGRAREGVFRIHAEANGSNDPNDGGTTATDGYSSWFEHHHGSRPVEEPPPPPSDHAEEPGFSLSVTTDRTSYTQGQTVHTTVTACNETDQEQHHEVTADPPLTVVYMRPDDEHDEVAYQGQHYDRNHDEPGTSYPVFEITFAARECRSYRYAWDQTRNSGPEGDPRMGQREPGTYEVEAIWEADWTGRPEGHHAAMHGTSPRFELR